MGCDPTGTETKVLLIQIVLQSYGWSPRHHYNLAHKVLIYFHDGNDLDISIYRLISNPNFDVLLMLDKYPATCQEC